MAKVGRLTARYRQPRNRQRSKVSALCEYLNKQKTAHNPAVFALVPGLEGYDGKRLAQRRQHLQECIKLRVGVSALHSGDLGLFNAAQGFKLALADALFLPCFNQLRDERNAHIAFRDFFRREMLLVKFFIPYRETALRIIHAFPSLSLKSANSRLACSISRFGVFWDFFTKLCRRTKAPSTHPANRIRSSIGRSSRISPSRCLAYFSGR